MIELFLWILISYFLGSFPSALVLTKLIEKKDIRIIGSGNIGATNAMRTGNKKLAILVFLIDFIKGLLPVLFCPLQGQELMLVALTPIMGHVFPIWLKGKGGKGVATAFGVFMGLNWMFGVSVILSWIVGFILTRTSFLSALIAFTASPLLAYYLAPELLLISILLSAFIIYTHRSNIQNLYQRRIN